MDNARAYNPVAVGSAGENVTYLPPNSNYTFSGTEAYVNSGLLFPQGQVPPGAPAIEKFTVTFEKPGTFGYACILHPWMTGNVVVRLGDRTFSLIEPLLNQPTSLIDE